MGSCAHTLTDHRNDDVFLCQVDGPHEVHETPVVVGGSLQWRAPEGDPPAASPDECWEVLDWSRARICDATVHDDASDTAFACHLPKGHPGDHGIRTEEPLPTVWGGYYCQGCRLGCCEDCKP